MAARCPLPISEQQPLQADCTAGSHTLRRCQSVPPRQHQATKKGYANESRPAYPFSDCISFINRLASFETHIQSLD